MCWRWSLLGSDLFLEKEEVPNVVVALNLLVEDVLLDNEVPKVVVAE